MGAVWTCLKHVANFPVSISLPLPLVGCCSSGGGPWKVDGWMVCGWMDDMWMDGWMVCWCGKASRQFGSRTWFSVRILELDLVFKTWFQKSDPVRVLFFGLM